MVAILRLRQTVDKTGGSRSKTYQYISQGLFPPPIKIGSSSGWPDYEVDAINRARIAGKNDDEIRQLVAQLVAARASA